MLLGLALHLAALRSPDLPVAVCVVSPRVEAVSLGDARGEVPLPSPQLVVVEPLQEVRIERGGRQVWRQAAPAAAPLSSPLAWPLTPIAPGEEVLLRLRPRLAPAGAYAHVELVGAPAGRMDAAQALLESLADQPRAWGAAIEAALVGGDVPLAWALLFHPRLPANPDLQELRAEVIERGCGD